MVQKCPHFSPNGILHIQSQEPISFVIICAIIALKCKNKINNGSIVGTSVPHFIGNSNCTIGMMQLRLN